MQDVEIVEMSWAWEREPDDAFLRSEFLRIDRDRKDFYWCMGIAGLCESEVDYGREDYWKQLRLRAENRGIFRDL